MKPDENWRETRILAEDLDLLLGLPKNVSEDFLKILENLIVHRFIEQVSQEDFQGKDLQITLPYLGSLVISCEGKGKISTSFVPRNSFYRKIKSAYVTHESPLIKQCGDLLGKVLSETYEEGGSLPDEYR